jgi:hypothetical protein
MIQLLQTIVLIFGKKVIFSKIILDHNIHSSILAKHEFVAIVRTSPPT